MSFKSMLSPALYAILGFSGFSGQLCVFFQDILTWPECLDTEIATNCIRPVTHISNKKALEETQTLRAGRNKAE